MRCSLVKNNLILSYFNLIIFSQIASTLLDFTFAVSTCGQLYYFVSITATASN